MDDYILDLELVVDLSLLCTFQKMRSHLDVKESDPTKFPADKLAAVAEVLRSKSTFLRLSEDGVFSRLLGQKLNGFFNGCSSFYWWCRLIFDKYSVGMWTGKRVGRVHELKDPAVVQAEVDARSIAANPFPYNIKMNEVEAIFKEHTEVTLGVWIFLCPRLYYGALNSSNSKFLEPCVQLNFVHQV